MDLDSTRTLVQLICSPIGNLGDITYRAVECLKRADLIACEDTRHSKRLLAHYEVPIKELVALHDHNEGQRSMGLIERITANEEILAVISDAGSPSISDPGFRLVQTCVEKDVRVEVIPGPSAVITGLVGSGLPTDKFSFNGFLPVKSGKREKALQAALDYEGTSVFFESPHRILKTLAVLQELDSERKVCVARELTKKFETYHRGRAGDIIQEFGQATVKGEITLIVEGLSRTMRKKEKADKYAS